MLVNSHQNRPFFADETPPRGAKQLLRRGETAFDEATETPTEAGNFACAYQVMALKAAMFDVFWFNYFIKYL